MNSHEIRWQVGQSTVKQCKGSKDVHPSEQILSHLRLNFQQTIISSNKRVLYHIHTIITISTSSWLAELTVHSTLRYALYLATTSICLTVTLYCQRTQRILCILLRCFASIFSLCLYPYFDVYIKALPLGGLMIFLAKGFILWQNIRIISNEGEEDVNGRRQMSLWHNKSVHILLYHNSKLFFRWHMFFLGPLISDSIDLWFMRHMGTGYFNIFPI